MGNLLVDPTSSPIQQPYDKYWDAPMTRREAHTLFIKLGMNDSELMGMADTASILINYLCEKLGVKREDVQSYVDMKTEQLKAMREELKKAEAKASNGQSNS